MSKWPTTVPVGRRPRLDQLRSGHWENAIRIEPEDNTVKQGRAVFRTQTRQDVERVEFLLNGQRVAVRNRAPFQARINLGPEATFSEVTAIAFDADGFELDRDTLFVNEPTGELLGAHRRTATWPTYRGRVEVEANVKLPDGERLDTLDFFWGNRRFATLDRPPYRAPVFIPVDQPDGFLRVVANLPDGRTTEDVVLMNRPGFGTQIGVELVELYVVATDRRGLPVRGLERDRLLGCWKTESIKRSRPLPSPGDLPLTVGLAIDSSSSLFVRMPAVQRAARDFTRSLVAERDQAFLVEFGSRPQMVTAPTRNLRTILDGISGLEPRGTTPVWEAVELSLREIEGIPGRKALVVFYDGDDEDAESAYRESLRLARKTRECRST